MICPRCRRDTALWTQKVNRDGTEIFLCDPCRADWKAINAYFGRAWWRLNKPHPASVEEFRALLGFFLKDGVTNPPLPRSRRKEMARSAAYIINGKEVSKLKAIALGIDHMATPPEDYAWAAGVVEAVTVNRKKKLPDEITARFHELTGHKKLRFKELPREVLARLEPYFCCLRAPAQISLARRSEDIFSASEFARMKKEGVAVCQWHPDTVLETERTFAYMAGLFDVLGKWAGDALDQFKVELYSRCTFHPALASTFLGGTYDKESSNWGAIDGSSKKKFLNHIAPYMSRKDGLSVPFLDAMKTERRDGSYRARQKLFLGGSSDGGGEDRASNAESTAARAPHPRQTESIDEHTRLKSSGYMKNDVGGEDVPAPDPPSIIIEKDIVGTIRKRYPKKGVGCFVCRMVLEGSSRKKGGAYLLMPSAGMSTLAKVKHIRSEFGVEFSVACAKCEKMMLAHEYETGDLSICPDCQD